MRPRKPHGLITAGLPGHLLLALGIIAAPGIVPRSWAQNVSKFDIARSPIELHGPARQGIYLGGVGRQAAFFGYETGEFEAWAWPLKLLHGFQLGFKIPDYTEPIPGESVAKRVIVRPELMTVVYSHATFTVRQHMVVPLHEPGLIILLDVDAVRPLEIVASFKADLDLMWPAGIGGQYAFYDSRNRRFILSESRREYNAYVGSPYAVGGSTHPAHAVPDAPSVMYIAADAERLTTEFIPIVVAGGIMDRDSLAALYSRLLGDAHQYYEQRVEHARKIREDFASLHTPDDQLDLALEWAKVNLDEALACNPDLGCGLVAGYGPSGRGRRPGFGWFFGGDASINIMGILPYGGFDLARAGLSFQARNRREADGKMPHEITQSAKRTREDWYRDFPYAYYHADTTPYWIVALWQYWLQTGDVDFVRENRSALRDAYRWVVEHDSDGDAIVDNTAGGLGAVEVGAIGAGLHQDIYLAGVSVESLRAVAELAAAVGDMEVAQDAAARFERATANLEREYYRVDEQVYAFGVLEGGETNPALTVWPATAMSFGLLDHTHAQKNLDALASHRILADWGARMLDSDHELYDPLQYNMGTVWGFVTGFASWALFNYDRPHAGYAALFANARSTFQFALGRNPELMSGAFFRTLDTTVPHQFFATSMIPTPLFRGLLGLAADAPRNALELAPRLPADWDSLSVHRYPVGSSQVDISIVRRLEADRDGPAPAPTNVLSAHFTRSGDGPPLTIRFAPELPPGSRVLAAVANGRREPVQDQAPGERFAVSVALDDSATVAITYEPGIAVVPRRPHPPVGYAIAALRIIDYRYDWASGEYLLRVEGRGGRDYGIDLISPRGAPTDITGARLRERGGAEYQLRATIEGPADRYTEKTIRFKKP